MEQNNKNNNMTHLKSNVNNMLIGKFLEHLENRINIPCYRSIDVKLVNGNKIPCGEKNNMTIDEIKNNRGNINHNTWSVCIKYIPNLFMIDFDFKEGVEQNDLYNFCIQRKCPYTITKKGFHFYIMIINDQDKQKFCYSNQQKVYKDDKYDIDLIKINNCWEDKKRVVHNVSFDDDNDIHIPYIHQNVIFNYLDKNKLNICDKWKWEDGYVKNSKKIISPPISPTTTDEEDIIIDQEDIDQININDLKKYLFGITNPKQFNYDTWWKIGSAVHKETNGSPEGKALFLEWSRQDINVGWNENKHTDRLNTQWSNWINSEFCIATLVYYYKLDNPEFMNKNNKNPYKTIYMNKYQMNKDTEEYEGNPNINGMIDLLNQEFIFIRETGEIICLDGSDKWYAKKTNQFRELLCKYNFEDFVAKQHIKIADIWINNINRRQVLKIGFDPRDNPDQDIFNIWKGMRISKENASQYEDFNCDEVLYHIKNRLCDGDDENYNYVLNWLAHLLQKPWIKMGVVICLRSSKEGAGKGILLNLLRKIIGDNHYFQCNNLEQLTGSFNGIGEGKLLINPDEAFWGKDKKKEGMLKNLITEETKLVNKKNKESYIIDDFCNYIVTTNNDCFIPAVEGGRRFFPLEVSNELSGIQTPEKKIMIEKILKVSPQAFAHFLYTRDISNFNPRQFNKTPLLQEQIEHNWCSVRKWWKDIINAGGFSGKNIHEGFCEINEIPFSQQTTGNGMYDEIHPLYTWGIKKTKYQYKNNRIEKDINGVKIVLEKKLFYEKDFIYSNYEQNSNGYKLDKAHFWINFNKHCVGKTLDIQLKQFNDSPRKRYIVIETIDKYREIFNELQDYNYTYDTENYDDWD
tara:strand:- start:2379 stop:4949 length:2571 start_codon:yes stop_codon:yes gene_type:complete